METPNIAPAAPVAMLFPALTSHQAAVSPKTSLLAVSIICEIEVGTMLDSP